MRVDQREPITPGNVPSENVVAGKDTDEDARFAIPTRGGYADDLLMNGEAPYDLDDIASYAPTSPARSLLGDGGDPESPWRWFASDRDPNAPENLTSSLSSLERSILASVLMRVVVTEVFSPVRVNKLAAKFGLVPGALGLLLWRRILKSLSCTLL